jgi:uncharacterized membrane protein
LALALLMTEPVKSVLYQGEVSDAEALTIVRERCTSCHGASPTDKTIKAAPKGIAFDRLEDLKRYAHKIAVQAVNSKAMPLGNKTGMTAEERAKLGAWIATQK